MSAAVDHQEPALQRRIQCSLDSTPTAMLENECEDALIALAVLAWLRRQAPKSLEVRACMPCLLTKIAVTVVINYYARRS